MGKHAYLILAHRDDLCLRTLVELIDHPRNDIYLHMDLKTLFDFNSFCASINLQHSQIVSIPRRKVYWGSLDLTLAELSLFEAAVYNGGYSRLHLVSGSDLPLKSQSEIHKFFDDHQDKQFIRFQDDKFTELYRVSYWHPFQKHLQVSRRRPLWWLINSATIKAQELVGVRRNKGIIFQKGDEWVSLTPDCAKKIIGKLRYIADVFRDTYGSDEIYKHTIIWNSRYRDSVYNPTPKAPDAIARYIDWDRGVPYTFRSEDLDLLLESGMMFARKFDPEVDRDIILSIRDRVSQHANEVDIQ